MKVFLVGGEDTRRAHLRQMLDDEGHAVHVSREVEASDTSIISFDPSLVVFCELTDRSMSFCRRLKHGSGNRPIVVFMLARTDRSMIRRLIEAGADDIVIAGNGANDHADRLVARCALWDVRLDEPSGSDLEGNAGYRSPPNHPLPPSASFGPRAAEGMAAAGPDYVPHRRPLDHQRKLAELGLFALKEPNELALMARITEYAREMLEVDASMIFEPREEEDAYALRAGVGWEPGIVGHAAVPDNEGEQVRYTLRSRAPIAVVDLASETRFSRSALLERHEIRSGLTVPIEGRHKPHGVLGIFCREQRRFSSYEVHLLQLMANILGERIEQRRAERALENSEMRAKAVLDTTVDAIITIDEHGRVDSFNKAAEELFGYSSEEVIGENVKMLMPSPYREEHDSYLQSYRETGEAKIIGVGREVVGERCDGTTFPLQLSVSEVYLDEERLFTGVIRDLSEKKRLEREILRVSEQERRRIGQDLHDGLGQMLNAIAFFSETLTEQLEQQETDLAQRAKFITEKIREADNQARSLGRGLVMVNTDKEGLGGALRRLCASAEELYGVDCKVNQDGDPDIDDATTATHLYRIAQEAINNAVRHGDASIITITLSAGTEYLRLRIRDDGIGIPESLDADDPGMGVRTMHYRARLIGGTLRIQADPSGGTTVTCTLPLQGKGR